VFSKNWNSAVPATGIPAELKKVASDASTITGTWSQDYHNQDNLKALAADPEFQLTEIGPHRSTGAPCHLKNYPACFFTGLHVVRARSQYGPIEDVSLPDDVNLSDIFSEAVQKYGEHYNQDVFVLKARSGLYHLYFRGEAISVGGQAVTRLHNSF
jgi:hypothetical protein